MKNLKRQLLIFIFGSLMVTSILSSSKAGIAFSGESNNSLSISSNRSENNSHYLLEIKIKGVPTSKVTFETDFQTLYLSAENGGVIQNGAIAGAQVINLVFYFPSNANLTKYFREDNNNKILISVPKSS